MRAGILATCALGVALVACSVTAPTSAPTSAATSARSHAATSARSQDATPAAVPDWRADPNEPYPFVTPVPPLAGTPVDGVYVRVPTDPYEGQRAPCRRCPPYPLDRGVSRLSLVAGRYEMLHHEPRYRILAHYTVAGDELVIFNDPECSRVLGRYRWTLSDETLTLEVIDDGCAFGQRAEDLAAVSWTLVGAIPAGLDCEPPGEEAAVSGHWPAPSGC